MSKIVIWGGEGFIGTALRRQLARQDVEYTAPTYGEIDLSDSHDMSEVEKEIDNGDTVIMIAAHTAERGQGYVLTSWNIQMAQNLIDAIEGKDIPHCVYLSSDSVYGPIDDIMDETTPLRPTSLYGMMHMMREQMFRERFGDKLTILRPCAVYGPGDTHNAYGINQFVRSAKKEGIIEIFGEGEEMRSNIHVDDLAAIIAKSALDKVQGIFNANCGAAYTFMEIAKVVQENVGSKDWSHPVIIESKPRTQPITHRHANNSRLQEAFHAPRLAYAGIAQMCHECK